MTSVTWHLTFFHVSEETTIISFFIFMLHIYSYIHTGENSAQRSEKSLWIFGRARGEGKIPMGV